MKKGLPYSIFHIPHSPRGFSLVEVILASALFALFVTALVGAYLYGQESTALAGNRARATMLAEEGLEATRNIRDAAYTNLVDGTWGLTTTSNQWNLFGASDTNDLFTRQVTLSAVDANRKNATSTITWQQNPQRTGSVSLVTRFTNWMTSSGLGNWSNCIQTASLDFSGSQNGIKIQVQGNYVYLVRNDGSPDFVVVDVSNPLIPALVGSLSLTGAPSNIAVSGNYAYVSTDANGSELQVIDVSTPSLPSMVGSYDAPGNANALGVFVSGTSVYLVRASSADNEFFVVDVSTPTTPTLVGSLNLGADGNEVFVSGSYAYVASSDNAQELQVVNISVPALPTLGGSLNLSGNQNALTLTGTGNTIVLGRADDFLYLIDVTTPTTPATLGSYNASGQVSDVALGRSDYYVYLAGSAQNAEFQIVDIYTPTTPVFVCLTDLAGQIDLGGVAYSQTLDRAFGAGSSNTDEFLIISPQ